MMLLRSTILNAFERAGRHCPVLCWGEAADCHRLDLASRRRKLLPQNWEEIMRSAARCASDETAALSAHEIFEDAMYQVYGQTEDTTCCE